MYDIVDLRELKTPYKNMNQALGPRGGFQRGTTVLISSLPDEGDRQLADDVLLGAVLCNTSRLLDDTKTPLIAKITCNPTGDETTTALLNRASEVIPNPVTNISEFMHGSGIELRNVRATETEYSLKVIYGYIAKCINEDFELSVVVINDLDKVREVKTGTLSLDDVYNSLREYFKIMNITFISTLPLSDEVNVIRDNNPVNYLKIAADQFLLTDRNSRVDRMVDTFIVLGRTPDSLKVHVGKHRGVIISEADREFDILVDENGRPIFSQDIKLT